MSIQALEWPKEGNSRVPYRVFDDPEIYRAELDRVFLGASWQYLVLANEGDTRAYSGYNEEKLVASLALDLTAFPDQTIKQRSTAGGRRIGPASAPDTTEPTAPGSR